MKSLFYFIALFFFIGHLQAQTYVVSGTILDAVTKTPLIGATIIEKNTSNGEISSFNGKFSLNTKFLKPILVVNYLGYETIEIQTNTNEEVVVNMSLNNVNLSEIIVTALNVKRSSKNLGYAVQKLNSEHVSEVKSPNFIDNLSGLVAGVTVSHGATGVGSTSKITIRGESSFTNNNPLIVVDGTPINNNTNINNSNASASGFQEVDFGNGGMEINQDDISSVTILKGPNSAALYGSRAANGVIIVSTKTGSEMTGLGISFNSTSTIEQPFKLPDFQNRYGQGNSGKFEFVDGLGGGINDNISYSWGPELDKGIKIAQYDSPVNLINGKTVRGADNVVHGGETINPTPFVSNPDNLKNFYGNGLTLINNIAFSSGFDKGNFRLSLTDFRSNSFIPGVNLDRKSASGNFIFKPLKKLKISSSFQYSNSGSDNRPSNGYGSENINYSLVAWGPRSLNIQNLKDYWQPGLKDIQQYSFNYTYFDNPYFILLENRNSFVRDRIFGNLGASYKFSNNLDISIHNGIDYSNELRQYRRNFSTNRFKSGAYAEQHVMLREINSSILLNYNKTLGNITTKFSVGSQRMDRVVYDNQNEVLSLAQPGIFNFSNAASPINSYQFESNKRINSVFGIVKFGYKNYLFMDITGRNDWSSALASPSSSKNVSFFYPSISLAYIVSNSINLPQPISYFKLRASWAQVGNDTEPYLTSSAFVAGTTYNSLPTFTSQNVLANANIKPEQTTAFEIGTDMRFFNDKLNFDITYYNALTNNQIVSFPIPISSGFKQQVVNGGAVKSEGLEIVAGASLFSLGQFRWNTLVNYSKSVATISELPDGVDKITLAYSSVYDNVNQTIWFEVEKGGRIGDMYGTGYKKNQNGDFIIDQNGRYIADNNLRKLGNYNPDFILGWNNKFTYKKWKFSFLFDWHQGGKILSRTLALAGVAGQLKETENRPEEGIVANGVVNVGTNENPIWEQNKLPVSAESYYRQFYDRNHEENNMYNASYLKLKQFSIGYDFMLKDENSPNQSRVLNVSLIGRNIFAWSEIPHFDPEQLAVQANQFVNGVEDMSYPSSRSIGVKIGIVF